MGEAQDLRRVPVRMLVGLAFALGAFGGLPAAAAATTYFAAPPPTGNDANDCLTMATPCTLHTTVETIATMDGDEVVVLPGSYVLDTNDLQIQNVITVRGLSPQQRPSLQFDTLGTQAVVVVDGGTVRDLEISNLGGIALSMTGTGERLLVRSESALTTCTLDGSALLRDSFCVNDSSGDAIQSTAFGVTATERLVNVTALSPNNVALRVSGFHSGGTDGDITVNATNVIARGDTTDIRTQTNMAGDSAVVNLDHSNYLNTLDGSGPGTESITPAGTNFNQTANPIFQGAAGFHQAAGSPTIDMGATNPADGGTLDLDGEPRCMGLSTDIGADELSNSVCAPPASPPASPFSQPLPPGAASMLLAFVKGKALNLLLRCAAGGGNCNGRVAMSTVKPVQRLKAAVAKKRKGKPVVLGSGSFSIPAGQTQAVKVPLTKRARKLFGSRAKVKARATITVEGTSSAQTLTVKRKGKKKRK